MKNIKIQINKTADHEFEALIKDVGWERYTNMEILNNAMNNSLCCFVARDEKGKIYGMVRLVGDGFRFVYIQDLMVLKEYQRKGIGTKLMDAIFEWINENCPKKTYIHLFSDKETKKFYKRYGFQGPEESFYGMSLKKFDKKLGRNN